MWKRTESGQYHWESFIRPRMRPFLVTMVKTRKYMTPSQTSGTAAPNLGRWQRMMWTMPTLMKTSKTSLQHFPPQMLQLLTLKCLLFLNLLLLTDHLVSLIPLKYLSIGKILKPQNSCMNSVDLSPLFLFPPSHLPSVKVNVALF